ncbi:hypothetical protein VNO77_03734 [Canavalia gladiata]|uniref:Uncharacterized protein n=1 Tax=Canavalia gladiata TaxID=3824 RepID=A0AAN9MVV0_CANGL
MSQVWEFFFFRPMNDNLLSDFPGIHDLIYGLLPMIIHLRLLPSTSYQLAHYILLMQMPFSYQIHHYAYSFNLSDYYIALNPKSMLILNEQVLNLRCECRGLIVNLKFWWTFSTLHCETYAFLKIQATDLYTSCSIIDRA